MGWHVVPFLYPSGAPEVVLSGDAVSPSPLQSIVSTLLFNLVFGGNELWTCYD